jgi:hypothetical protein
VNSNANTNLSATKIWQNWFKLNFPDNRSCLSVHITHSNIITVCYLPSAYFQWCSSSPRIRNYADRDGETGTGGNFPLSHAAPRHIRTAQVITQPQKLHSQIVGLVTAVMYQVTGLTCSFVYGMGLQLAGIIHNNLADDAHLLFYQMRPANQPTITGVDLCHTKVRGSCFTETRVIRYQPFVSVHNATFHSGCYTIDKGSNKTCENNIILPTNIQYLKIHVRNWIWSQTSQWYINRMKYTWGDRLQPISIRKVKHTLAISLSKLWLPDTHSVTVTDYYM